LPNSLVTVFRIALGASGPAAWEDWSNGAVMETGEKCLIQSDRLIIIILIWISLIGTAGSCSGQQDALLQLYREAQQAQSAGDYQKAIANYKRIVVLRPEMAEAYSNLGILYYDQRQSDHALTAFKKAIELKPELPAPYF